MQPEEEGDRLTPDELVSNLVLLLIAGHETISYRGTMTLRGLEGLRLGI